MFGFHKTVKRFRAESDSVVIPALHGYDLNTDSTNTSHENHSRKTGAALKFAVCFILAVVVLGVTVIPNSILPSPSTKNVPAQGGSSEAQHSFTLVAYAAETGTSSASSQSIDEASKTPLIPDVKVQLPNGRFSRDHINPDQVDYSGVMRYSYSFSSDYLKCEDDNIQSVTYSSARDSFIYHDRDTQKQMESDGKSKVCNLAVPGSIPAGSTSEQINETFKALGKSGKLDAYNEKYIDIGSGNTIKFIFGNDWDNVNTSFGGDSLNKIFQKGATVTTKSGGKVIWSPSADIFFTVEASDNFTEYTSLPPDTLTITAKFTDGQTLTKTVSISYNADGCISATLQGK
jgi:hypothetical protein